MKTNTLLKILFCVLIVQLSSCIKNKNTKHTKSQTEQNETSETIFDRESAYYIFIQKNHPEALKDELVYFAEKDIDLDGKNEAIIAFGKIKNDDSFGFDTIVNTVFTLKNDNKRIVLLDKNLCKEYITYNVELVKMRGKKESYLCFHLTNGANMEGFSLYKLVNNKMISITENTADSMGNASDYLVDTDNDGIYDGYGEDKQNENSLYYYVTSFYTFKDDKFTLSEMHVEIEQDYPDTIEKLLLQYISLRSLDLGRSKEVDQRLKLICTDKSASSLKWNKNVWSKAYVKHTEDPDNSIEIDIEDDINRATVSYVNDDQIVYMYQFDLEKKANKWVITQVTSLDTE